MSKTNVARDARAAKRSVCARLAMRRAIQETLARVMKTSGVTARDRAHERQTIINIAIAVVALRGGVILAELDGDTLIAIGSALRRQGPRTF